MEVTWETLPQPARCSLLALNWQPRPKLWEGRREAPEKPGGGLRGEEGDQQVAALSRCWAGDSLADPAGQPSAAGSERKENMAS